MPFLTHYHILLFFRNFWQGKLPPITQHEQISMSNWNLKNWLTVGKLTWQPRQQKHLGFFYVKVIVYLTPQETTSQTMRSTSGNCQKNKSNYKQTQIINHHWSISAFLELQESQTYCSRAPSNKLSQLFKQYHFSLQWSIVLWPLLTAIFDLHLCNQRCNVIVRSCSCIISEKKQNGGILRSP